MRKTLSAALLATSLLSSAVALADEPPPPPPPPPPSETTSSGSESSGSSGVRAPGGLFDSSQGHHRPMMISVFAGIPEGYWGWGFPLGVSGRFYLPIVHDGFIPSLNDEFGIEAGADLGIIFWTGGNVIMFNVPVEAMWDFHIFPNFDAYGKVGLALRLFFTSNSAFGTYVPVDVVTAVGLRYKINETFYLRAEVGYPWIKAGIGFAF